MKNLVVLATLVATTSIAAAQPAAAPEKQYVSAGLEYGGIAEALAAPATVEGGYRLGDTPLWAHGMLVAGRAYGVDETTYSGSVVQGRAGVEARDCLAEELCAVAGIDAALSHTQYMAEYDSKDTIAPSLIARAGLDVGGRHIRVRPGAELGFEPRGVSQIALTGAVAYQW